MRKTLPFFIFVVIHIPFVLWFSLTEPIIKKVEHPGLPFYFFGEIYFTDVEYIDHRGIFSDARAAQVWMGTNNGRLVRAEFRDYKTHQASAPLFLLDRKKNPAIPQQWVPDRFDQKQLQSIYDELRHEYERQNWVARVKNRVFIWELRRQSESQLSQGPP